MRFVIPIFFLASIAFAQTPSIEPGVSQELARWRAERYSDVRYKLNLTLEKMSPVLKGSVEVRVKVAPQSVPPASAGGAAPAPNLPPIILDWRKIRGFEERSTISNVSINGTPAIPEDARIEGTPEVHGPRYREKNEHLIFEDHVFPGENVIKLDFTSPILPSGSAITRYIDKEDGSEYLYSLFVPSDASTAFPVFDQPDLKARFELEVNAPLEWRVISNSEKRRFARFVDPAEFAKYPKHLAPSEFTPTQPISTYVFAFAAGPWQQVSVPPAVAGGSDAATKNPPATAGGTDSRGRVDVKAELKEAYKKWVASYVSIPMTKEERDRFLGSDTKEVPTSIYLRRSQLTKFQPHAAEVFRLNREAIKYFEEYFDYKFPFPKYDIVLIPEFPFGGMEHAGATFLREAGVIFPQEPTKNDIASRATLIFHEAAHQWFGDTVTMRWFDDLWLKEGFANFTAYKAMERIMPEMNAWKIFYERIKQGAYQTDSTKGTTAIYQPIPNLSAAKSAYGNIVYNKAPAFLRQAEFYLGEANFQTAVRAFLKKHEFGNAGWEDLVKEFETQNKEKLNEWADFWVKHPGLVKIRITQTDPKTPPRRIPGYITLEPHWPTNIIAEGLPPNAQQALMKGMMFTLGYYRQERTQMGWQVPEPALAGFQRVMYEQFFIFPNYQDYGYGIFLLDPKSRDYVLKNIQNEKDDFLRSMMWGALWDSVREGELDPREYVELVIRVQSKSNAFTRDQRSQSSTGFTPEGVTLTEDESTTAMILNRVSTAMTYYISDKDRDAIGPRLEAMLIDKMRTAPTLGQRVTYYRAFLNTVSSENGRATLKRMLLESAPPAVAGGSDAAMKNPPATAGGTDSGFSIPLKTKDRFDIVTKLASLNDPDAERLLTDLEKKETSDDAKRYAYAARAAFPNKETKEKYWNDFVNNKEISESWIEAAFVPFNSVRHANLTLPYLERALQELPNHKRNRKIFFVNGWLGAFIGGQRSAEALAIVNKFLADNPNLDRDLRLKILENVDVIERAVKIREKYK
jgi:aminopeptidase N